MHYIISFAIFFGTAIFSLTHTFITRKKVRTALAEAHPESTYDGRIIAMSKIRIFLFCLGLLIYGIHAFVYVQIDIIFNIVALAIAIAGIILFIFLILGRAGASWIRFSKNGITIGGYRGSYKIPWDNIMLLQAGEWGGNPAIFITLQNSILNSDHVKSENPEFKRRIEKSFKKNYSFLGAHIFLLLVFYKKSPSAIVENMMHYWRGCKN